MRRGITEGLVILVVENTRIEWNWIFCSMITFYGPTLQSLSGKHVGEIRGNEHYEY